MSAPAVRYETGARLFLRALRARLYVRVVGSLREISWLVSDAVIPNLAMCAYVLLYRAIGAPRSYEALAVIGGVLATYWINVLWGMGAQLYWEKQQGQLQLYFVAPCSRMAILTGMALGGILTTTLRSIVGLAIGFFILGVRVEHFSVPALLGVFLLAMTALYALGMIFASVFILLGREAWHINTALMEPVQFLSGLYFPVRSLGAVAMLAVGVLPLGLGVDAIRQVLLGPAAHGLLPVGVEALLLAAQSVVFLIGARASLAHLETLAKREGRLTQRWQ
jgi:ABC-2 type transport system permease protein